MFAPCFNHYSNLQLTLFTLLALRFLLWLPTRITRHNLGDLCTKSAEFVLQGGSAVQRRHPGLLEPLHPFTLAAEVGHRWVPVEHQERRGPPFVFQRATVAPENWREDDQLNSNLYYIKPRRVRSPDAFLSLYPLLRKYFIYCSAIRFGCHVINCW